MTGRYLVEVALSTHDDLHGHRQEPAHDCATVRRCGLAVRRMEIPVVAALDAEAVLVACQVATAVAQARYGVDYMATGAELLDFPTV